MKLAYGCVATVFCVVPTLCMTVVVQEFISVLDKNNTPHSHRTTCTSPRNETNSTHGTESSSVATASLQEGVLPGSQSANASTLSTHKTALGNGRNITAVPGLFDVPLTNVEAGDRTTTWRVSATDCGKSHSRSRRVVGGRAVASIRFPWNVALFVEGGDHPYCGGVVISRSYIMTAAHCVRGKTAKMISVGFGSLIMDYERLLDSKEKHVVKVSEVKRHPLFRDIIHGDDIAMLRLTEPIRISGEMVKPICLPQGVDMTYLVGQTGVVAGWGRISYGGEHSIFLRSVNLPLVSHEECCRVFKDVITVRDEMFCAGDLNGTRDACQGDSGGPLMWQDPVSERWMVLGIVSFGVKCAEPGYYGTYTKVASYIDWICEITSGELCEP